ncbi:MAG: hypothetical protein WA667_16725 [Candidatus Nitrosopolaris sp.]
MMIKEICLIAMVAFGLTLVIPITNVLANDPTTLGSNLHSSSLPHHGFPYIAGIGTGIAAIAKFKAHKDNPVQIHIPFK